MNNLIALRRARCLPRTITKPFAALVVCSAWLPGASGETISLAPQPTNAQVMLAGGNYTSASVRVGLTSSSSYGCATEFVFALPKLAFGDSISNVDFSVNVAAIKGSGFTFNGDLYSLGISPSPTVPPNYAYFQGGYGTDTAAAALQQHFLSTSPLTPVGRAYASPAGNAAIAADLRTRLASGATEGSYYFLRLNPDFPVAWNAVLGWNVSLQQDTAANQPRLNITTSAPLQLGRILIEYWNGVTGHMVTHLTSSPNFPDKPSAREYSTVMEVPKNLDVNSGARMRGVFYPAVTGTFSFAVASDDYSELRLSTDETPDNATVIASVAGWTAYQQWTKYPSQLSAPVVLAAGKGYYLEARYKQGTGTANLSIGWQPPGSSSITLMPATNVAPYDPSANYTAGAIVPKVTQSHPRLLLSPAAIARLKAAVVEAGSTPAAWWASIQTQANTALGQPVIVPTPNTNFITAARTLQDRVYCLAMTYLLSTDSLLQTNCLNKIYAELQSAANWGGTANNTPPGNWKAYQFLDVPEITHAFAIAYDWCYAGWTSTQRTFLVDTIVTHALQPAITSYGPPTANYLNGSNNWTIVCDGGLVVGALAILNDEASSPKAPEILDKLMPAFFNSPAMAAWAPDGAWAEAPTYWAFAMRYLSTFLASLETSAGTCFNFDKKDGIAAAGSFPLYVTGPLLRSFNFSDEYGDSSSQDIVPGQMYLGLKYNQPVYSYLRRQFSSAYAPDLIWYDSRATASSPTPASLNLPPSTYFRNAGIIILRSEWNNSKALFAGLKAGYNPSKPPYGSGHLQLEIGSFVFDALGVRWACDLARDAYTTPYFNVTPSNTVPNRWQYYRCRSEGNNTLVIKPGRDGGQALDGTASLQNFKSTRSPNLQQAVIDMSDAYARDIWGTSTVVTSAKRGLRFVQATNTTQMVAQIQDELSTNSSGTVDVNWFMHTATSITVSGSTALLSSGSNRLLMTIRSPSGAVFTSTTATPLPDSPDYPNFPNSALPGPELATTGTNKLRIRYVMSAGAQSATVKVDLCPYVQGATVPVAPTAPALSGW